MNILHIAQKFVVQAVIKVFDPLLDLSWSEAIEATRKKLGKIFDSEHPEQDITAKIEVAEQQYRGRAAQAKRFEKERAKTPAKITTQVKDPDHEPTLLDRSFGSVVGLLVFTGILVIPLITSGLLIESGKLPIVADFPAIGLAFGVMALCGFVASIEYRAKLTTIEGIRLYDRSVIGLALIFFFIWISLFAFIAYPLEVSAPAGLTDEYGVPITTIEASPPIALFVIATGLLDLLAGPVFHMAAARCLFPRIVIVAKDNPYFVSLQNELMPAAYEALNLAAEMLTELRSWPTQREAAREAFIETELARFRRRRTKALAVRHTAVATFLDEPDTIGAPTETPRTPANGALTTSHPNGQFS